MARVKLPPHLTSVLGVKRCSVCQVPFPKVEDESLSKKFIAHVKSAHQSGQIKEDSSQAAARIVREATKD